MKNMIIRIIFVLFVISFVFERACYGYNAEEVMEKFYKAIGGKEALTKVKSLYLAGKIQGTAFVTTYFSPFLITRFKGGVCSGMNKDGRWKSTMNGTVRYLQDFELNDVLTEELCQNYILFYLTNKKEIENKYIGEIQEDGNNYHIVEVKSGGSMPVKLFVNDKTWLIDKAKIDGILGILDTKVGQITVKYEEYKEVKSIDKIKILLPFKFEINTNRGDRRIIYEEISINGEIAANCLTMPEYKSNIIIKNNIKNASIPFVVDSYGAMIVKVKINEFTKEYNFSFDTGTFLSFMTSNLANELKTRINKLHFGDDMNMVNCMVNISSRPMPSEEHGIIGADIISQMVVEINKKERIINLYRPDNYVPPSNAIKVPLTIMWNLPFIDVIINKKQKATLLVDTGFTAGEKDLCLFSEFVNKSDIKITGEYKNQVVGSSGGLFAKTAQIGSIKIESYEIKNANSLVLNQENMKVDGIIGKGILDKFDLIAIDYFNKTLWLVPKR